MRPVIIALIIAGSITAPAAAQLSRASRTPAPPLPHTQLQALPAPSVLPEAAWSPQDPADSLWRAAREALNQGDATRAAQLYRQIRTTSRYQRSEYRVPSYYWEAFAREKIGTDAELKAALTVLTSLKREHPRYEGMSDVTRLESAINGKLAAQGNADARAKVNATASQAGGQNQECDETQLYALEALLHMQTAEAMPILKRVMDRRGCDKMREQAVFIISQKRGTEAEDILLNAVRNDPSPKVREQAVFWLSQVNSDRAVDALESIIRTSTDKKLLEAAVFALSQNQRPRASELLRDLATRANTPPEVRKNAIFWLSQRRDPAVGPLLRTLYSQATDTETKNAILFSISQRRDDANGAFLFDIATNEREDIEVRKQALFWAAQQRQLSVTRLGELYRTMPNVEMRKQVLFSLTQMHDKNAAIPQLIEIARTEKDVELRKTAIFWLGQSRDPRAVRFLSDLIGG